MSTSRKYGRLPAHPVSTHPRVHLDMYATPQARLAEATLPHPVREARHSLLIAVLVVEHEKAGHPRTLHQHVALDALSVGRE